MPYSFLSTDLGYLKPGGDPTQQLQALANQFNTTMRELKHSLEVSDMRDAWQVSEEDNVDGSNPLVVDIYIPAASGALLKSRGTKEIRKVILRVRLKAFRSYSATTASGGGSTVTSAAGGSVFTSTAAGGSTSTSTAAGGSTSTTSGSGGGTYATSDVEAVNYGIISTLGLVRDTTIAAHSHTNTITTQANHNHGGTVPDDGGHNHTVTVNSGGGNTHKHDLYYHYHYTNVPAHTHSVSIGDHTHNVTIGTHTHNVTIGTHTHTVDVPSHTHGITAAITTGATATNCTIFINGIDRTAALVGAATFAVDQDELDVTQYMTATGYNTIEIRSSGLGRIRCTAFVNLLLNI